ELKSAFNPLLDKMFAYDKEVEPFMRPVDPKLDLCPDYFDIVRRPMDFGTIKSKLDRLVYKDPWEIINEIYLVFGNAWLYNKKCSVYHKYACKLADVFEAHVDAVMRGLG
ncbi:hypothetical protein HELRODRAFT_137270, partial [Helobdella robusta]|uniref:Bromo domain-containing protein n=1 Tax=Helobdella robusta TaxID=6412 RepID=T1EII6_HELRO